MHKAIRSGVSVLAPVSHYGGKGNMKAKLFPLIPYSQLYVEPYFGAGSIFWNREPSPVEVVNDLHGDLINLMRCFQDDSRCQKLYARLAATLYSLDEFRLALATLKESSDLDDRAWAFYVMRNQGFAGIDVKTDGRWGRNFVSSRGMAQTSASWWTRFDEFPKWYQRIARVQIDNRDALVVIKYWDSDDTTFYLDPPYVTETRVDSKVYVHEASDEHHKKLVELALTLKGNVTISCYAHAIYKLLEDAGWQRLDFETASSAASKGRGSSCRGAGNIMGNAPRTETVYLNPKASAALGLAQTLTFDSLFEEE